MRPPTGDIQAYIDACAAHVRDGDMFPEFANRSANRVLYAVVDADNLTPDAAPRVLIPPGDVPLAVLRFAGRSALGMVREMWECLKEQPKAVSSRLSTVKPVKVNTLYGVVAVRQLVLPNTRSLYAWILVEAPVGAKAMRQQVDHERWLERKRNNPYNADGSQITAWEDVE